MSLRTARKGRNAGGMFWGCNDYPRCRGTRDHAAIGVDVDGAPEPDEEHFEGVAPDCPECGAPMQRKRASRGRNAGGYFWGCIRYPQCRGIVSYAVGATAAGAADSVAGAPALTTARVPRRVVWADGTLDRPGWICRYTTAGGSLRSVAASAQTAPATSQCWIARTEALADADVDAQRVAGLLRKILQRGAAPPIDPVSERRLLNACGLGDDLQPAPLPGDLSVRVGRRIDRSELEDALPWAATDFSAEELAPGSDDERRFLADFVSSVLGATAGRWFIPQPSLDGLISAAGLPAPGERRLDFLAAAPGHPAFLVEIDGAQHTDDPQIDQDRDALVEEAGYDVVRVSTAEVRAGAGLGLDRIEARWRSRSDGAGKTSRRLAWAPSQLHRAVLALLDGVTVGFLRGDRWAVAIDDPLSVVVDLLPPYFDLIAAVDQLWGGTVAPRRIVFGSGDAWLEVARDGNGYSPPTSTAAPDRVDLAVRLESDRSPMDKLEPRSDGPEVVVRSSFLPVGVLDQVYEGGGRIAARSEGEDTQWALQTVLRSVFAKADFREGQLDALFEVVEGRDCAVLLPTGAGKSLIYQLAGLVMPGRTLVIDPLVALMEDQMEGLRSNGIDRVAAISSFTTLQGQTEALLDQVSSGEALFVFVAPERLQQQRFRQALRAVTQTAPINLVTVDEAHCVSEWGHDFRTSYLNLGRTVRETCKDVHGTPPPVLALTGTASRAVLRDVLIELGIERDSERSVVKPQTFDRPELRYTILRVEPQDAPAELKGLVSSLPSRFSVSASDFFRNRGEKTFSGLVFVPHTNGKFGVDDIRRELAGLGPTQPAMYSGGPPRGFEDNWEKVKRAHAAAFKGNDTPLLVSTKAFGMGIDKPNIRYVVHYGIPGSIEGYYQEVGRAGRDRVRAECGLVLIEYDEDRARRLLSEDIDLETARQEYEDVPRDDADDITRQLYFFFNSFRGAEPELEALRALLTDIRAAGELGRRQSVTLPMGSDDDARRERERAIHRLVVLGFVRDYLVEWGSRKFPTELAAIDSAGVVEHLLSYVRRNQPGRVDAISGRLGGVADRELEDAILACAEVLIDFVYDTVARSRMRSLREMWLAARESQHDPNGAFRDRILDYLSQGAIAPTLERLVDRPNFRYGDWIDELSTIADVDDARELRGDSARMLASYPDHPGLLLARALSEVLDDRGDIREFTSNLESSLRAARERYGADSSQIDDFGRWLITYAQDEREGTLAAVLGVFERIGVAEAFVRKAQVAALLERGSDTGVRVLALAWMLEQDAHHLDQVTKRYERTSRT